MIIKLVARAAVAAGLLGELTACSADPTVSYKVATGPGDAVANQSKLIDSFYRQRNELTIEFKAPKDDKAPPEALVVANRRLEDTRARIMMLRADPFWTQTTVNLTKVENTDLIATAGSEVTDRRNDILTNAGAVLKLVLPLALGAAAKANAPPCPDEITAKPCVWSLPLSDDGTGKELELAPTLNIKWGAAPKTALPLAGGQYDDFIKRPQHGMLYSACRDVTLTYTAAGTVNKAVFTWHGKVADPNFLEFVAFPRKGEIDFHSECGVSVKTEKDPTLTPDALIATTVTQIFAVKDAIDKVEADKKTAAAAAAKEAAAAK